MIGLHTRRLNTKAQCYFRKIKGLIVLLFSIYYIYGTASVHGSTNIFERLWPQPIQIETSKNQFILDAQVVIQTTEREAAVADKLQKLLKNGTGIVLTIHQGADKSSTVRKIRLKIGSLSTAPQNTEGYVLRVGVEGVTIASESEAGLLYGAQTFAQLAGDGARDGQAALQTCIINDQPALQFRGTMLNLRYIDATNPEEIRSLYRLLDALAALKLNVVILEFGDNMKYSRQVFPAVSARAFTKAQVAELVKYARGRAIEVIPYLQVPSHVVWILSNPRNKELLEDPLATGWNINMCLSNRKTLPFLKDIIDETIEDIHPKQFFISMDEINVGPFRQCEQCRAQEPSRLLLTFVNEVHDIVVQQNVKMILPHDTFLPPPTVEKPHPYYREDKTEGWKVIDQLPKDIIICYWDYDVFNTLSKQRYDYFSKRGFKILGFNFVKPDGIRTLAKGLADEGALGMIATHWYYGGKWSEYDKISPESWAAIALTAQYGWNPKRPELTELSNDDLVYRLASAMPSERRLISERVSNPVPLDRSINRRVTAASGLWPEWETKASVGAILDVSTIQCGDVKYQLNKTNKGIGAIVLAGHPGDGLSDVPVTIEVNRHADSVAFLHVCNIPINYDGYNGYAGSGKKPVIGTYVIKYGDGSVREEYIKYRWNITDWNSAYGVFDGRIAAVGKTVDGSRALIISHEWNNPFPGKVIQEIIFSTKIKDGLSPALLALSLLGGKASEKELPLKEPLNKSSNELPQQAQIKATNLTNSKVAEKDVLLEGFEYESSNELSRHVQIEDSNLTSPVTWKINKEVYIQGKSSLELIIPGGETKTPRTQRVIVDVDLPVDGPVLKAKQLTFWVRCAEPSSFGKDGLYFGIYLIEPVEDGKTGGYRVAYKGVQAESEWRKIVMDVDSMTEERPLKSGKVDKLRISFWLDPNRIAPNRVYLDDVSWRSESWRYQFDIRKVWYEWKW